MSEATVHLACGAVGALLAEAPPAPDWLSASEGGRLASITTAKRREQFLAARWQARRLLAQAFGGLPARWLLDAPADAPPTVPARPELFLSVSHSGGWTACAVTTQDVGLDLEAPQRQRDIEGLVALCCTPAERDLFAGCDDREALFHELWTVKEAWLKRRREWIAPARLQQVQAQRDAAGDVRTWQGQGWRLALCAPGAVRWWTPEPAAAGRWQVRDLRLAGA